MPESTKDQPRGWQGEGMPKEKGPGFGKRVPNLKERFPEALKNKSPAHVMREHKTKQ